MEFGRLLERQLSKTFKTVTLSARQGHSRYFKLYYLPEYQSLVLMTAQTLALMIATMMMDDENDVCGIGIFLVVDKTVH
mgnify:CR=1 FL=1